LFLLIVCNGHFDFVKYNYLKTILTIIKVFMVIMWNIWDVTDNAERNELYKSTRDQNVQWLIFLKSIWRDAISLCVVLLCVFMSRVPCCDVHYDFRIKRCSVHLYLQLFVGGFRSYLRYLCLFVHSGVEHILSCVFALFVVVFCTICSSFSGLLICDCPFGIL
jgi:hypothetical protein